MPKIAKKKPGKGSSKSYKFDSKGRIVGPNGKKVGLTPGDTPIVISGGSLTIMSEDDLEDDDHPGQKTRLLHSVDKTKHVKAVRMVGFKPVPGNPNLYAPTKPACAIIISYE